MANLSLSNADCAILVFSLTDKVIKPFVFWKLPLCDEYYKYQNSFEEVSTLREAISEEFSELPLIVIGNKLDLGSYFNTV